MAFKTRRVEFISLLKCFEDSLQKADTLDGTIFFSQPLTFGDCMIVVVVSIFLNFFFFVSFFFFCTKDLHFFICDEILTSYSVSFSRGQFNNIFTSGSCCIQTLKQWLRL